MEGARYLAYLPEYMSSKLVAESLNVKRREKDSH